MRWKGWDSPSIQKERSYEYSCIFKGVWVNYGQTTHGIIQKQFYFKDMVCAYRKKYRCEHVLVKYSFREDNLAGVLLIDLLKTFNCMPYGLLIV